MKTYKTFAKFSETGISPYANVLYLQITEMGIQRINFKYVDNRFSDEFSSLESVNFDKIETKAIKLGFIEVPVKIAEILELGNYWSNFSKIEKYAINCPEFIEAVKNTAGYDGIPELE